VIANVTMKTVAATLVHGEYNIDRSVERNISMKPGQLSAATAAK
jgi:hypothetical protein